MGTITILNTKEYKEQPVPEVGKEYHIFDDGKVKPSRHFTVVITALIPKLLCTDLKLLEAWQDNIKDCPWLFNETTDWFVLAEADDDYYTTESLYFVRTTDGGWFSIDYPSGYSGARLDIDGKLYDEMLAYSTEAELDEGV